jgi:hypothetical protein
MQTIAEPDATSKEAAVWKVPWMVYHVLDTAVALVAFITGAVLNWMTLEVEIKSTMDHVNELGESKEDDVKEKREKKAEPGGEDSVLAVRPTVNVAPESVK